MIFPFIALKTKQGQMYLGKKTCELFWFILFLSVQNKLLNKMAESLFFTLASFRNEN